MKPGAGGEEDGEIAVAAEVVAEEGVEGSRDKMPHERTSCLLHSTSFLLLAVNQMYKYCHHFRTTIPCHHHQKTPHGTKAQSYGAVPEAEVIQGTLEVPPGPGDHTNLTRSHNYSV
jgi:hypothetical protein